MKITVVGAGAVGATTADNIIRRELAEEVVLLDIKEGVSEGKSLDMYQTAALLGFNTKPIGSTNDYEKTKGSDVVVITSGLPRKPGMTREELIGINAGIVKGVTENLLKYSPKAIVIVVSNPMDTMTYLALAMDVSPLDIHGMVIGGHGDTTMIPLTRLATYNGIPVSRFLSADQLEKVAADTMVGGATLTKLIGTSAWYAPGAATMMLVESIVRNQKRIVPCSVYLNGEYGQKDICMGVPVVLGRGGWEKIINLRLSDAEKAAFEKSAEAVRSMNAALNI
jgi:malate dehydrogenase